MASDHVAGTRPGSPLLILGVGNVLMGDEGVGVHVVRQLEREGGLPPGATVVDGGTGGFHLLSYLGEYDPVVMIDATLDGKPPGSVTITAPKYATDFPRTLSAHDIGLRDLVESAALLGDLPAIHLIAVSVAELQPMQVALSPAVQGAVPAVVQLTRELAAALATGA